MLNSQQAQGEKFTWRVPDYGSATSGLGFLLALTLGLRSTLLRLILGSSLVLVVALLLLVLLR